MPYMFYGDNTFLINKKVNEWTEKFSKSQFGDLNITCLEGGILTYGDFSKAISSLPFFGTKRLIIIKNLLLLGKDDSLRKKILNSLNNIPETSIILFVEYGLPDMRTALFKSLNKPKFSQKLTALSNDKLSYWIQDETKKSGMEIDREAKTKLQVFVGVDLWRMENEIKKLALFAKSQNRNVILAGDIEELVKANNNSNVFQFIDAIAQKNSKKALLSLKNLVDAGEDEFYIFSMIVYQFRNLFSIFELNAKGLTPGSIAKEAKLHPFIVSKSRELLRHYDRAKFKKIYLNLFHIDKQMKAGLLGPSLALLLLTVNICKDNI
ncbi:MAG: DNA polymerase III subunit delta [Patescibacteria group bacterium]